MGVWRDKPWENDSAADWFAAVFDGVELENRVSDGLDNENPDKSRAAAYLLSLLGNPYVWPGDPKKLAALIDKALLRMESLAANGEYLKGYGGGEGLINSLGDLVGAFQMLRNNLRSKPE